MDTLLLSCPDSSVDYSMISSWKAQSSLPTYDPVVAHRRREKNVSMQHQ
jgi:hypothetical protein